MPQLVVNKRIKSPRNICASSRKIQSPCEDLQTRIFELRQCEAEEDCITKTQCSSKRFPQTLQMHKYYSKRRGRCLCRKETNLIPSNLNICKKWEIPKIAVGEKRLSSLRLSGLRFFVVGTLGCTV